MELNCVQDYDLGQAICVNTNIDIIFKTVKTHFATAADILKQKLISFSTAQIS